MKISSGFVLLGVTAFVNPLQADTKVSVELSHGAPDVVLPHGKKGPPPWAPAHGYRAKHLYRYFPGHDVYFEPRNKTYFYLEAGAWKVGVRLPASIKVDLNRFVEVGMDVDQPHRFHNAVKSAYPKEVAAVRSAPGSSEGPPNGAKKSKGKTKAH